MNKLYAKLLYLILLCIFFVTYYFNVQAFKEEIEFDNNVIQWNAKLLESKKKELFNKKKSLEHYNKMFIELPFINQVMENLAILRASESGLDDLNINVLLGGEYNNNICLEENCLLWTNIKVSFTSLNGEQISSFFESIKQINGMVIQLMNMERADQQRILVNLLVRSYYKT